MVQLSISQFRSNDLKKRNFIPLLAAALLLTGCGTGSSSSSQSTSYSRDIFAMDTYMTQKKRNRILILEKVSQIA